MTGQVVGIGTAIGTGPGVGIGGDGPACSR